MIHPQLAFANSYARARVLFLEGAATAGMSIRSHKHPLPGREGETLAMDTALDGSPEAERLLIVSSACHGVEGFCGSGVQVFAAHELAVRDARRRGLNRNVHGFSPPLPANTVCDGLHSALLPAE